MEGDGGHETGGSGGEAHVDDAAATLGGETREHGVGERRPETRVAADRDGQVGGGLARLSDEPIDETRADEVGSLLGQGHGLALDALESDAANVRSVLKLAKDRGVVVEEAMAVAGTRGRRTVARGRAKAARRRAEVEPRANARRKSVTASTVETRETSGCCMRSPKWMGRYALVSEGDGRAGDEASRSKGARGRTETTRGE